MYYIALVHKDPDSDFGESFPDFPGLVTAGRTLEPPLRSPNVRMRASHVLQPADRRAVHAKQPCHVGLRLTPPANRTIRRREAWAAIWAGSHVDGIAQ
jgi:hypothetical protein